MNSKRINMWVFSLFFLLLLFLYSLDFGVYNLFRHISGVTGSYLAEQLLFVVIIVIHFIAGIVFKKFQVTRSNLLVLLFFLFIPLLTHSEIFLRYFYKEDFLYNLSALRDSELSDFYKGVPYYKFYPFMPFVLIYYFFKTNIIFYNFFTLILLSLSGFLLYKLNLLIIPLKKNSINIMAFIISILYLTSPTYLDSFLWISTGLEGGFTNSLLLAGIIYYILFLRKRDIYYYLGAFLVLLLALKTSFTRIGYLPAIFVLLEILFFTKKSFMNFLGRIVLILLPLYYFLKGVGYFKNGYASGGSLGENIYLLFAYLPQALIPYELLVGAYNLFKKTPIYHSQSISIGSNFYFSLGIIIFLFSFVWILRFRDKAIARYSVFFIISALICLFFFVNFGNLGKIGNPETLDNRLSTYAVIIGHRYYQGVNMLFSVVLFILVSLFLLKHPRSMVFSICVLLVIFTYNVYDLKKHLNTFSYDYAAHNKAFYEGIIKFVPEDKKKKILFLTNGAIWKGKIHADPSYIEAFYPPETVILTYTKQEFLEQMKKGNYNINSVYAFYMDKSLLKFTDQTQEYRKALLNR